ncbi:WXG100 family type VII secretion target [Amycolatopsis camponoti]|uniref:WXG100 family type VII secretion target n=1 Tax=Amycolatopsis camponoti TaxID=2606593 RepID=UPI0018C31B49|nr:WXG100 family type VII secretion target [Amycolatopsis camponoti]
MGTLRVDFSALRAQADALDHAFGRAEELLAQLEQELKDALGAWLGEGQNAFATAYGEWVVAARELHSDLPRIREFVLTAHDNHGAALSANLGIWRGPDR